MKVYREDFQVFFFNKFIFIEWYENKYFVSGDKHGTSEI